MEIYSITKSLHYAIGIAALATFWIAALARKGSPLHKRIGKIYLLAMVGILVSSLLMGAIGLIKKPSPDVAFLFYLVVITATACWRAWRAIRDKRDFPRYVGPAFRVLEVLNLSAGVAMMILGIAIGSVLYAGFSLIGIIIGIRMFLLRRNGPRHALWWRSEHINAMLGNGVATHIAFLAIGLPRVLPASAGQTLQLLAWFGPPVVALILGLWLSRKYAPPRGVAQMQATGNAQVAPAARAMPAASS